MAQDLRRGQVFEDYVEDYFKSRGWTVKRAKGYNPGYDLWITKGRQSIPIECKYQEASDRTGNYALEEDSLNHTQSAFLITGTLEEFYIIDMATAHKLFNEYPHVQMGDFAFNQGALVPRDVFRLNYQRL